LNSDYSGLFRALQPEAALIVGALAVLGGSGVAPFIYSLF